MIHFFISRREGSGVVLEAEMDLASAYRWVACPPGEGSPLLFQHQGKRVRLVDVKVEPIYEDWPDPEAEAKLLEDNYPESDE